MDTLTKEDKERLSREAYAEIARRGKVDFSVEYLFSAHVLNRGDYSPYDFLDTYSRIVVDTSEVGGPGSRDTSAKEMVLMKAEAIQDLVILKSLGFDFQTVDDRTFVFWLSFAYAFSKPETLWWWFSESTKISRSTFTHPATRLAVEYGDTRMFDIILLDSVDNFRNWRWEDVIRSWASEDPRQLRNEGRAAYKRAQYCLAKIVRHHGPELELDIRSDWELDGDDGSSEKKRVFYEGVIDIMTRRNLSRSADR